MKVTVARLNFNLVPMPEFFAAKAIAFSKVRQKREKAVMNTFNSHTYSPNYTQSNSFRANRDD